jgi:hypothetical protein
MRFKTAHFLFSKQNCKPGDCEDGLAINHKTQRYFVADGASEAFDSRKWARLLSGMWKLGAKGSYLTPGEFVDGAEQVATRWKKKMGNTTASLVCRSQIKEGIFFRLFRDRTGMHRREALVARNRDG